MFDFSPRNKQSDKISDILNLKSEELNEKANLIEIKIPENCKEAILTSGAFEWEKAVVQELLVMYDCEV